MKRNVICPNCGFEFIADEICQSGEHNLDKREKQVEEACAKAARTGNREDLNEYLRLRRNL